MTLGKFNPEEKYTAADWPGVETLGNLRAAPPKVGKFNPPENSDEQAALEAVTAEIDTIADWYARLVKLREMKRDVTEREKETADFIKGWLRDREAEFGEVDGRPVVRRRMLVKRVFDTRAFKAKEPELAERFTVDRSEERLELIDP